MPTTAIPWTPGLVSCRGTGSNTPTAGSPFSRDRKKVLLGRFVRQFFFGISGDYYWDLAGNLETRKLFMAPLNLETQSGEHIEFNINPNRDVLPYDFEISKGVILPAGPYDFTNYNIELHIGRLPCRDRRPDWRFGGFYSGHYDDVEVGLSLKYKGYATISLNANLVRADCRRDTSMRMSTRSRPTLFFRPTSAL